MFRVACTFIGCFSFQLHSEDYPVADIIDTWLHPTTGLHLDYSTIYGELRDKFVTSGAPLVQGTWERREQWEQTYDKWCLLSSERLKKAYKFICEQKQGCDARREGLPSYKLQIHLSEP